jgi:hypothetical protein
LKSVLKIPLIKHAEKMVKIRQTGFLKLNFENIPKNAFSGFCQKISQAMDEVEFFLCQFSNPWAITVPGMGCYTSKCEKAKINAPY